MPANQITTKFSVGQKVWLMEDNKAVERQVESVATQQVIDSHTARPATKPSLEITYGFRLYEDAANCKFKDWKRVREKLIFETKADLLASL